MSRRKKAKLTHAKEKQIPEPVQPVPAEIEGPKWLAPAFSLLALIVFVATTCRTVPGGDSGELITVAYNLGVAHPPGYPLYSLIAHLSTYLPFGSVAFRVNLLSAIIGVASGYMIYLVAVRWVKDRWLAVTAAGIFIFSPLAWRYAVVAEVFTLNNFFIASLLYVTLRFHESPSPKWAYIWTATLGLACSHHHTIIFLAAPLFIILLRRHARILLAPKVFFGCIGLFLLCLTPYLYLPWAGKKHLLISWGSVDTWDGFWTHFLRREYGTFQLATGNRDFWNTFSNLKFYALDMWLQMLFVGVPVAIFAIWQVFKGSLKQDGFARLLFWGFITYTLGFHTLANMDLSNRLFYDVQSRFWLLPNLILALFMAYGIKLLLARYPARAGRMKVAICAAVLVLQIGIHYEREDHSKNTVFYDLGKGLLDGFPQGALAFMRGDVYVNSVRYMQAVEGYRTDVMAIPFDLLWWPWMRGIVEFNFPKLKFPGKVYRYTRAGLGEFTLRDFFELNQPLFPSFIGKLADHEAKNLSEKFKLTPVGFMNRITPLNAPFDVQMFLADIDRADDLKPPLKGEIREKSWEAFVYYNFWDREMEKSKVFFEQATRLGENQELLLGGIKILERMINEYPESGAAVYRNLGVAYQLMAKRDFRYYPKMVKAWKVYVASNPKDDPQLAGIRQAVQNATNISIAPRPSAGSK
jgi:hypothetical protein